MTKFGLKATDEVNPHIVYNLNKLKEYSKIQEEFLSKYEECFEFLIAHKDIDLLLHAITDVKHNLQRQFLPLAYRLDISTDVANEDRSCLSRFGGLPSQALTYNGKYAVEKVWPICGKCHKKMLFLGQLKVSDYIYEIHKLTAVKDQEFSAFAMGHGHHYDSYNKKLDMIFFCPCWEYENPNSDAVIVRPYLFDEQESQKSSDEISNFIEKNKLDNGKFGRGIISPKVVTEIKIGMDLECSTDGWKGKNPWDFEDLFDDFNDKFNDYRIEYTMWGKPQSQQTEHRYFSSHFDRSFRMAPYINWNDECNDITNQIYGCYRTAKMSGTIYGRMDSSCT